MRVLLASDGSSDAMQAAEWAAASGLLEGASIVVLSVVTPPGVPLLPVPIAARLDEDAWGAAEETRAALGANGTAAEARVAQGDAREEIMRMAEEWDADLVA